MSLEQAIEANTAAIEKLIAVFQNATAGAKTTEPPATAGKDQKVKEATKHVPSKEELQSSGATSEPEFTAQSGSGTSEPLTFETLAGLFRDLLKVKGPEVGRAVLDKYTKSKLSAIAEEHWPAVAEDIRKAGE